MSSRSLEALEHQRDDLAGIVGEIKRRIRADRAELQEVAASRRRLIEKIQQFGIEVVLVDADGTEQGVEETTHGRQEASKA